jgi:transposase-like protein
VSDDVELTAWEIEQAPARLEHCRCSLRELLEAMRDRGVGAVERRRKAVEGAIALLRGEEDEVAGYASRFSEKEQRAAVARVEAGERAADVAAQLGVSAATVYSWRSRLAAEVDEGVDEAPSEPAAELTSDAVHAEGVEVVEPRERLREAIAAQLLAESRLETAVRRFEVADAERADLRTRAAQLLTDRDGALRKLENVSLHERQALAERDEARALLLEAQKHLVVGTASTDTEALASEVAELKDDLVEAYRETRRLRRLLEQR